MTRPYRTSPTKRRRRTAGVSGLTRPLADLATDVNTAHARAVEAAGAALAHARDAGRALLDAKAQLPHGAFGPWLRESCPAIARSTVSLYMRVARRWPELAARVENDNALPLREAQRLLAGPRQNAREAKPPRDWFAELRGLLKPFEPTPKNYPVPPFAPTTTDVQAVRDLIAEYVRHEAETLVRGDPADLDGPGFATDLATRTFEAGAGCVLEHLERDGLHWLVRPAEQSPEEFYQTFEPMVQKHAAKCSTDVPSVAEAEQRMRDFATQFGLPELWESIPMDARPAVVAEYRRLCAEPPDVRIRKTLHELARRYDLAAWVAAISSFKHATETRRHRFSGRHRVRS